MDIFDKVKNELIGAASEVQDRAKDVSTIMQLQRELKKKESFIESIYVDLGKKYYEEHKEDKDSDFTELEAAEARVAELKEEIADVKGTVTCGNCGAKIADNSSYCHKCGAKIGEDVEIFAEDDIEVED